jgi:hypothetical protein
MELITFSFSLVKLVPDRVRAESVNVGVIVVDGAGEAAAEFLKRFKSRARFLDPVIELSTVEKLLENLAARVEPYQGRLETGDSRIRSEKDLLFLSETMKNLIQVTAPKRYRAVSLRAAVVELFTELVSPQRKGPSTPRGMTLARLRRLIRDAIQSWGGDWYSIEEDRLQQGRDARHYADFWLAAGNPLAAFIAIPDDPGDRDIAWMRRDSVPTISSEFRLLDPKFKTVVVFPPNGQHPSTAFVSETMDLLSDVAGVIVTHANELAEERDRIAPRFL